MRKALLMNMLAASAVVAMAAPAWAAGMYLDIEVTPWVAVNVYGSASWAAAEQNAVQGIYTGASPYGTPGPAQFNAQSNVTSKEVLVTNFNSWRGDIHPVTDFGAAYANEYGNRMHFGLRVDGLGTQFSISQMSFFATSSDPGNALGFGYGAGSYNYGSGYWGVLKGADGVLWTADDTFVQSGANTQLVDGLVGRGSGNSLEALCTICTDADKQFAINSAAAYFSSPTTFTGTYDINGATGSGTINIAPVPGPIVGAGIPGLVMAAGGLLALARRRRKADPSFA